MESGTGMQVIDGSVLEGGGQILRNAISLAALLQKPVRIENIRHSRSSPGLKNQHRTGLELAAQIASAKLTGCSNGSTQVEFVPGKIELPGYWKADTVTAGATTLLVQVAFPMLLFGGSPSALNDVSESVLDLMGGTNAGQAPQIDYTQHVFLPFFKNQFLPPSCNDDDDNGTAVELKIKKRGYFPKGGGEINVRVRPLRPGQKLRAVNLVERGRLVKIGGLAHCAGLPKSVGNGMCEGAVECVKEKMKAWAPEVRVGVRGSVSVDGGAAVDPDVEVDIEVKREPNELTRGAGSGIVVWAEFENGVVMGGSAVGKKGLEPRVVGKSAVEELFKGIEAGGCVEEWMQDQMIIFMALAEGKSEVRCGTEGPSLHTKTAIWVAEQLTEAKFEVKQEESGHWMICCEGIGFTTR
ncbi:RTC domain-containing 1 [Macrolepiota fuliginosa MF-IS2]|uniref:RTC domain-containing 1 n=1 Tax=Macrolepiota fuliginosa MF-IS2 TaxID=1400762 RepID=A0A9P5XLW9_9AGAR|nr:RTC domain-containing 1 [Macrolepiota fuliginosa MF-IS2]